VLFNEKSEISRQMDNRKVKESWLKELSGQGSSTKLKQASPLPNDPF